MTTHNESSVQELQRTALKNLCVYLRESVDGAAEQSFRRRTNATAARVRRIAKDRAR